MLSNLPPGVTDYDIDPPFFCEVCGAESDSLCLCPECPACSEIGNPKCYEAHGLVTTTEQDEALRVRLARQRNDDPETY